jgi:putative ABC transport system permease protein
VNIWTTAHKRGLPRAYVGMANVYDFRARNHVFTEIAALRAVANFNLTGNGEPERLNGSRVSANLFPVLGVTPLLGRTFTEDEDEIGHEHVALLTYGLWLRRFGGDPSIVGRTISLNGEPHTVVGVMRPDFAFPTREFQIYTPLTFDPNELIDRLNYSYLAVARLKPGVTVEQARGEISTIAAQLEREFPKTNEGIGAEVVPMHADTVTAVRKPLYILLAAVAAMLLIGCANLANLLAHHRRRRRPHPPRSARRGRAAAGVLELQAARAGSDGARRENAHRPASSGRVARRRDSLGGSGAARVRRAHPRSGGRPIDRIAMAADRAARRVRVDRAAAREHRRLRRDCVRRGPAQP